MLVVVEVVVVVVAVVQLGDWVTRKQYCCTTGSPDLVYLERKNSSPQEKQQSPTRKTKLESL